MWRYLICVIYLIHTAHAQKSYLSQALEVCAGQTYELGCGYADGTTVMKLDRLLVTLMVEEDAYLCVGWGDCTLQIGGDGGDEIVEPALLNLYKSIQHNCQGKPMCTGTLPVYTDVELNFELGAYDHRCGWDGTEYLSNLNIVTKCQDAGTIETLPPYEYEVPVDTTTTLETTPTTTVTTTTTPAEVTTPEATTPEVTTPEVTTPEVTTPEATTDPLAVWCDVHRETRFCRRYFSWLRHSER